MFNPKAQRFGKAYKAFGDFGEIRRQKKPPHTEVYYFPVYVVEGGVAIEVLRSLQNATSDQVNDWIRKIGANLQAGSLHQTNAESILDLCYAELGRRLAK